MTFDELFSEHSLTPEERKALVMHLATMRAQKTVAALQYAPSEMVWCCKGAFLRPKTEGECASCGRWEHQQ